MSLRSNLFLVCLVTTRLTLNAQNLPTDSSASSEKSKTVPQRSETVVVTGTFAPVPQTDIDRSITIIDTDGQDLLYNHWVDYLGLSPSVDFRERAPAGVQADLTIRGSTFGQTLVLVDGLRMNDVQTAHHDMDLPLPTDSVKRIEILRGSGSTLYGSDAMAGTINVITSPAERSDGRIGASVGNFGINEQNGSISLLWRKFDLRFDAERDFSSGFRPDRDYRNLSLFSSSGAQTEIGRSQLMFGYSDKPYGADQFYGPFNSWERTKSWFTGFKQQLGRKTEFDFAFRRHTDEFVLFRNRPSVYENNHIDKSWQADLRRQEPLSQNSTLFYGGQGIHESVVSNNLGDHDRSRGAIYVDYDVRAFKRFSFSAGAREEIIAASHGEFVPALAAGVWLKPGLKLKGSASRGFRVPSYTDLYYHDPANLGNPNLRPERAWEFEGGLLWNPAGRFQSQVTVFARRDRDVIDYVRTLASGPYTAENIQKLNFTGIELSGELQLPSDGRLLIAYTGLRGVQESLNGWQAKYTLSYPRHDAVVAWNGRLPGRLIARTRLGVIDRYDTDPYGLWDVSMAREFGHLAAHLELSNITDTQYQEIPGVVMPGRSAILGLDFFWRTRNR